MDEHRSGDTAELLRAIVAVWDATDCVLETISEAINPDLHCSVLESRLQLMLGEMLSLASRQECKSTVDVALKAALWRRDAPEFSLFDRNVSRADILLYSAYRDLLKMTGMEDELLIEEDRRAGDSWQGAANSNTSVDQSGLGPLETNPTASGRISPLA